MSRLLLLLVLVGCGANEAGTRSDVDAGPDVGLQAAGGAGGSAAMGIDAAAGSPIGGSTGAAGMATAMSCLIPETEITAVAPPSPQAVTGGTMSASWCSGYDQTVTAGISKGQIITGTSFSSGWVVQHYMINPSPADPTKCMAVISFSCPGCAGTQCGDGSLEVTLTLDPQ